MKYYEVNFNPWRANPIDYAGEDMITEDGRKVTIEHKIVGISITVGDYPPKNFTDMTSASYYLNSFAVSYCP